MMPPNVIRRHRVIRGRAIDAAGGINRPVVRRRTRLRDAAPDPTTWRLLRMPRSRGWAQSAAVPDRRSARSRPVARA
jgi:hypothetical protein